MDARGRKERDGKHGMLRRIVCTVALGNPLVFYLAGIRIVAFSTASCPLVLIAA